MTHPELVKLAERWLRRDRGCGVVLTELDSYAEEIPDAIGFRAGYSILIECKTRRADFFSDSQKVFRTMPDHGMGSYRFYLCAEGVIKISDLPENWGLIWVNGEGKARMVHGPKGNIWGQDFCFHPKNMDAEQIMLVSALRRLQNKPRP